MRLGRRCVLQFLRLAPCLLTLAAAIGNAEVVSGVVTDAGTGAPVADTLVVLYADLTATTTTDSTGAYTLDYPCADPLSCDVTLVVQAVGYYAKQTAIHLSQSGVASNHSLVYAGVLIAGKITDASTGQPVANAYINAGGCVDVDTFEAWVMPYPHGTAAFSDLAGNYAFDASLFLESAAAGMLCSAFEVSAAGYIRFANNVSFSPPYPAPSDFALSAISSAVISGVVSDRASGAPIAGATVVLTAGAVETLTAQTTTDANGAYSFSGEQFPYTDTGVALDVRAPGYYAVHSGVFVLYPLPVVTNLSLPYGGAVIAGKITDTSTGQPIASAYIDGGNCYATDGTPVGSGSVVRSDLAGNYAIDASGFGEGAAAGMTCYGFSVSAANYFGVQSTIGASPPYPALANFALSPVVTFSTTTTLTSSTNPAVWGQVVTLTATVSSVSAMPTGNVTFYDGNTAIASAVSLNGSGVAKISLPGGSFNVGSRTLRAAYAGGIGYAPSTSTPLTQTITKATSTIVLSSDFNPQQIFGTVNFTASVTCSDIAAPDGPLVTFREGSNIFGSTTLNAGRAWLPHGFDSIGTDNIKASYAGNADCAGSTSPVLKQTIVGIESAISISSSLNPAPAGDIVILTASVTSHFYPGGIVPSGSVTFKECTGPLTYNGTYSNCNKPLGTVDVLNTLAYFPILSPLKLGLHPIAAMYSGDANYAPSTSLQLLEQIK